jgi:hypothetical protein
MRTMMITVVASVLIAGAAIPAGQDASSQMLAADLAKRLGSSEPKAFAAAVPDDPSRFVAALHMPGVQLLVISATYQAPILLRELIAKNDHQRVYRDLNAAGDRAGRFFVEDLGADGLQPDRERDAPFDISWRDAVQRTLYNGDWKKQELTEAEYRTRFQRDAAQYAHALQLLVVAHAAQASNRQE